VDAWPSFNKQDADTRLARGKQVADFLSGAWRVSTGSPFDRVPEEISDLLVRSGAGGLAWCRVRPSGLRSHSAQKLKRAYRVHSLESALHERDLKQIIPRLRDCGVEPIVVKGWAIARLYPESGMRPYSDLDFCVLPSTYLRAKSVLMMPENRVFNVDLHQGFGESEQSRVDEIFARAQLARLGNLDVRILCAEDHLRFICLHLLRHGAVKPVWLCDVGVLMEAHSEDFNWDLCLSGSKNQTDWVACVIGLAHHLLGVGVEGTPVAERARNLPSWLVPAVLRQWGIPYSFPGQVAVYLRNLHLWRALPGELLRHWPNPIEATATVGGRFNGVPRLPYQIGHVLSRTASLFSQLPAAARRGAH